MQRPSPERAAAVLGMHRSGTSMASRAVNMLGAWLGEEEDLLSPGPDNPAGFWERRDFMDLHDRILSLWGRTWDSPEPMPLHWEDDPALAPLARELKALVARVFGGRPFWAFKDPRACLLLALWRRVLEDRGAELTVVLTVRHPLDSARSLEERNGISKERALSMWDVHYRSVLGEAKNQPLIVCGYDALVDDAEREMARLARALGVRLTEKARCESAGLAKPELRHFRTRESSPQWDLSPETAALHAALEKASSLPGLVDWGDLPC